MIIYKIQNKITNKIYIGKTSKSLEIRWKNHLKCVNKKINRCLYDSINKYGINNFIIEELCKATKENINDLEKFYINEYNSLYPNGYNMTNGGDGGYTLEKWSNEDREKLYKKQGEKRKGKRSSEWRQAISLGAIEREKNKTIEQKKIIANKISKTLKEKNIKPPLKIMFGKDNPNYNDIPLDSILDMIKNNKNLKEIANHYSVSRKTINNKLKPSEKTFTQWRKYYGLTGNYRRR